MINQKRSQSIFLHLLILSIPFGHSMGNPTRQILSQNDINDNLILHLPMDQGEGDVVYDQVGDNDGTIFGAKWFEDDEYTALEFDGVNDYVRILSHPLIETKEITISAFVNYYEIVGGWSNSVITQYDLSDTAYKVTYQIAILNDQIVWAGWGHANPLYSIEEVELNTWYHIVALFDGQYHKLWINGELQSEVQGFLPSIKEIPTDIGRKNEEESSFYFDGLIDEVKIFNVGLTDEQIFELYTQGHSQNAEMILETITELDFNLKNYVIGVPVIIIIVVTAFLIWKKVRV